jgi:lysozyme family protein
MTQDDARTKLNAMSEALTAQRNKATDPAVRQALMGQITQIEDQLDRLALLDDQQTAQAINAAGNRLEGLLSTAQLNPFDPAIQHAFKAIADKVVQEADTASKAFAAQEFKATEKDAPPVVPDFSPPAPVAEAPAPIPTPAPIPVPPPGELPPIVVGNRLAQLAQDYTLCWAACRINPDRQSQVATASDQMLKGRTHYQAVSARTNGVPWQLIGIMHGLECGYSFFKHLHNGDSLAAPTHQVPAGRPPGWNGTGTWEDSAVDAVRLKFGSTTNWSLPQTLYALESFNGFGYRPHGVRSPYLWSFSNLYTKGRYVADHEFDPESISKQVGSALILKVLEQRGMWP